MRITRRQFIKTVSISAAVLWLNPRLLLEEQAESFRKFDPNYEYGNGIELATQEVPEFVLRTLHESARQTLPKGTYYQLRKSWSDWERKMKVCWYYGSGVRFEPDGIEYGYKLVGSFIVG